jgi:hypothetical protein
VSAPFELRRRSLDDGRAVSMQLQRGGEAISWAAALAGWREGGAFEQAFVAALLESPFEAYLWETPPLSAATTARPFEWVLVRNDFLARVEPDDFAFAEHIRGERGIRSFDNLGGDARLIVPCAEDVPAAYPHLAAFVRLAPRAQVRSLWSALASAVEERLARSSKPCWVSTSGLGVFWVHVRVDEQPKYYAHAPYRMAPG